MIKKKRGGVQFIGEQHDYDKAKKMMWDIIEISLQVGECQFRWPQLLTIVAIFCQRFVATIDWQYWCHKYNSLAILVNFMFISVNCLENGKCYMVKKLDANWAMKVSTITNIYN